QLAPPLGEVPRAALVGHLAPVEERTEREQADVPPGTVAGGLHPVGEAVLERQQATPVALGERPPQLVLAPRIGEQRGLLALEDPAAAHLRGARRWQELDRRTRDGLEQERRRVPRRELPALGQRPPDALARVSEDALE